MSKEFSGVFTALLTPFDKNNQVNETVLRELVAYNVAKGVTGFYVGGSTAEAFLLTAEERRKVMEIVRSAAPEQTLIAHIGCISEDHASQLGVCAKDLGYDAVSSVAPFYYKFSFNEIKSYYYNLADASQLPMLIYHFPAFSGVNMGVGDMAHFLNDERFMGIKYTSNDFFMLEQCKARFPGKIIYNGFDEMFLAGLSMGADGGIGSTYNFMADKFVKIRSLFQAGDIAAAQEVQKEANRIIAILCEIGVMQTEKEVMNQLGMDFGVCRRPFRELTDAEKARVRDEIIPYV